MHQAVQATEEEHEESEYGRHNTKSTRFSDRKRRDKKWSQTSKDPTFAFDESAVNANAASAGYNGGYGHGHGHEHNVSSTRSRPYGQRPSASISSLSGHQHHQQRSEQMMHNMQPLVLKNNGSGTRLLSVDENQYVHPNGGGSSSKYQHQQVFLVTQSFSVTLIMATC